MTQEILMSYWKSKAVLKWFYWRQFSEAQKMVRLLCRQIDWNYSILIVIWFCQKLYDQNWILALEIGGEIKFKVGVIPKWTLALVVKSHENHQCFVYSILFYMISTILTQVEQCEFSRKVQVLLVAIVSIVWFSSSTTSLSIVVGGVLDCVAGDLYCSTRTGLWSLCRLSLWYVGNAYTQVLHLRSNIN